MALVRNIIRIRLFSKLEGWKLRNCGLNPLVIYVLQIQRKNTHCFHLIALLRKKTKHLQEDHIFKWNCIPYFSLDSKKCSVYSQVLTTLPEVSESFYYLACLCRFGARHCSRFLAILIIFCLNGCFKFICVLMKFSYLYLLYYVFP